MKKGYSPSVDATPEVMSRAIFALPTIHEREFVKTGGKSIVARTVSATIGVKKTMAWGESGFPARLLAWKVT